MKYSQSYLSHHTGTGVLHVEQLSFNRMSEISIHYLFFFFSPLLLVLLRKAVKSCSHVFPLRCRDILAGIPGGIFFSNGRLAIWYVWDFLSYQPHPTHMSPGEFWTYCPNRSVTILSGDSLSRFLLSCEKKGIDTVDIKKQVCGFSLSPFLV